MNWEEQPKRKRPRVGERWNSADDKINNRSGVNIQSDNSEREQSPEDQRAKERRSRTPSDNTKRTDGRRGENTDRQRSDRGERKQGSSTPSRVHRTDTILAALEQEETKTKKVVFSLTEGEKKVVREGRKFKKAIEEVETGSTWIKLVLSEVLPLSGERILNKSDGLWRILQGI